MISDNLPERLVMMQTAAQQYLSKTQAAVFAPLFSEAAARIRQLDADARESALQYLSDTGQMADKVDALTAERDALRAALDRAEADKAAAVEAERERLLAFAINLRIDGEMSAKNPNIFGRRIADFGIGQVDSCDRFIAAIRQSGAA